jgi:hypothetical protein
MIVGFASWKICQSGQEERKPEFPEGVDPRFLVEFWRKAAATVDELFNPETDIGTEITA